jgi:peptidoglycan/LPS O-acetylase OafA/YrhL
MHSSIDPQTADLARAAREIVTRSVAAVGLAGIALIHLLDSLGKFQETPYMGWMYVGLMLSCLALAATLLHTHAREAWLATIALPASAIVGFVLTRTTGLPQAHGDVGNWSEPLGLAALFVEGAVIAIAAYALAALHPARLLSRRATVTLAGAR